MNPTQLVALSPDEQHAVSVVLEEYTLPQGERRIFRNTVGFVNKTYIVEIGSEKFVLRRSSPQTTREHLEFEVEVFRYLAEQGFALSPHLVQNITNEYCTEQNGWWLLQKFIPGEIRASWNDTACFEGEMLRDFFRASARFSKAARGFVPSKAYSNTALPDFPKNAEKLFAGVINDLKDSPGKTLLVERFPALCVLAKGTAEEFERLGWEKLPQQLVHFDIHPGNVHYEGDKVVGLFDFDWARMDNRIADLASTISQSCWIVGGADNGRYLKEKVADGLRAYREAYGRSEFSPEHERALLTAALPAYLLFQLLWSTQYYREHYREGETEWVLRLNADACLRNDFDQLFA